MRESAFDEVEFFRAIAESGVRSVLIGRRALVLLGLPLLTADYDFWIDIEGIAAFNAATAPFDLLPSRAPDEARLSGRYVLQNDERVDVLVARSVTTVDGENVLFEAVWSRRREIELTSGVRVSVPTLDDLIATKRFGARPKDLEDIRLLEILRTKEER